MSVYVTALVVLMLGAIAPSFAAWDSWTRGTRGLFIVAVLPLLAAMALTRGLRAVALTWFSCAALALVLDLIAEAQHVPETRQSFPRVLRNAVLAWPLSIPAAVDSILIRLGLAAAAPEVRLPDPPRGPELFALSDDAMLMAAHQLLSGESDLTLQERTILAAEAFNREVHGGGFVQWFHNTDNSITDTERALRAVGAERVAGLLLQAASASGTGPTAASMLRSLDDDFFALEREEDLTSLVARFVRQHRSQCPALDARDP